MITRQFLHAKIHRATITECSPDYNGSISIGMKLLWASGISPNEKVLVACVDNGARFETYVIADEDDTKIGVNGAAAQLVKPGMKVIIMAFASIQFPQGFDTPPIWAKIVTLTDYSNKTFTLHKSDGLDTHAYTL
jgi:aspartate 1-decarboxylase